MSAQAEFFSDLREVQRREQFRMRRLQVYNWGTFSGLHDIRIAERGFLFVGRSGSGKSTLLDALTALLIPPQWQVFNAAAREGDRSRRDRNQATYVRGAWGEQQDSDSGEVASQYLRRGSTWSALALTLANEAGRIVTLVQLYSLRGSSTSPGDVKRHYMIAQRHFDIATELDTFDLDLRALKNRLEDVEHFNDTFRPYAERFRSLMSIESELALKLLHKTQSAKNLGDLNEFLREFMLDEPETFEAADHLVREFVELDAAHQEVVTARRQVETLRPARDDYDTLQGVRQKILEHETLLAAMDGYRESLRLRLLLHEINALQTRESGLAGRHRQLDETLAHHRQTLEELREAHRAQGGYQIESLESRLREAKVQQEARQRHRAVLEKACRELQWSVPDSAERLSELSAEAKTIQEAWHAEQEAIETQRDALRDEAGGLEREFKEVRAEIQALERQPSNMPARMLTLRHDLAAALGIAESELPFVGELLQVKDAETLWQGAIERVLHGFALSLLVDERYYAAVSAYVDKTHLGGKLVYYRWNQPTSPGTRTSLGRQSLVHKLELKSTVHRDWLEDQLQRRFDYVCVDNLTDFRRESRALTLQGQVKQGADRHEKDDRSTLNDRRHWVLGFDNREKLTLFMQRGQEIGRRIAELADKLENLKSQRARGEERIRSCERIVNLQWQDVDIAAMLDRVTTLERQLQELREGSSALRELGERIDAQNAHVEAAQKACESCGAERLQLADSLRTRRREQEDAEVRLTGLLQPNDDQRAALDARFTHKGEFTLGQLDARHREVERALREELQAGRDKAHRLTRSIEEAFNEFKREWPMSAADFPADIESADEYFALLKRLEWDGLPQHEERFFRLLREQSSENLAALNSHLAQARKDIIMRLELVNDGLAEAEFNPGTHLQIEMNDRYLPQVKEFREQVARIIKHAWGGEPTKEEAERRFLDMRDLVRRLGGDDPELKRWRNLVLDVRLHVDFMGKELDKSGTTVEVYRSGAGKSGGQREKLSTTCLAAALRYQLGGSDGGLPVYAPVILDEAFGKADNEFTEQALKIFEGFGFQMIVATPLKAVMTLESFIGGACFVEIKDRKHSSTLPIEYDHERRRLDLPEMRPHGEELPASP